MARVRLTAYSQLSDMKHEGLRGEAASYPSVECGTAIMLPDDGSGPMEGFFIPSESKGMCAWGFDDQEMSDWIECTSLKNLFEIYSG